MNIPLSSHRRLLALLFSCVLIILQCFPAVTAAAASSETDQNSCKTGEIIHILLIGQDRRGEDDTARADSIILCSFRPDEKQITITSFLRDLYVPIPGHQDNRLNAAFAFGGMDLMKQTIETNFDLTIDGCIEADFSQFPQIIDILGGVSINLRQDEADAVNRKVPGTLTEGTCLLTGEQALAYSRLRYLDSDGDFSRTERQRKLITSLLDCYRSASLLTILSSVADLMPMITTDLSKKQILFFAAKLFPLLDSPQIRSQRIPASGSFTYETIRNMEVLTADMEMLKRLLHELLFSANKPTS